MANKTLEKRKDDKGRILNKGESQLEDGRYRYRYTDLNGKRHTIYSWRLVSSDKTPAGKKKDNPLRDAEKEINKKLVNGVKDCRITLNEIFDKYLSLKITLNINTVENYKYMYDKDVRNTIGQYFLSDIKKSDIKDFYALLYKNGYSVSTIQLQQNILYPTFKLAIDDGLILINPCEDAMNFLGNISCDEKEALTIEEQEALQLFLKDDLIYNRYYPLIMTCLSTGARISEALGLTWDDIDFKNKIISINHQTKYRKVNGKIQWTAGKTKWSTNKKQNIRLIPVHDDIINILKKHKQDTYRFSKASDFKVYTIPNEKNAFGLKPYYSNFVFINSEGKLFTPNTINRTLESITKRYNKYKNDEAVMLPHFSSHVLRYTFATRNAENKMDCKVLQALMGHKNIATTMDIYNKVSEQRKIQEVGSTVSPIISHTSIINNNISDCVNNINNSGLIEILNDLINTIKQSDNDLTQNKILTQILTQLSDKL